MNILFVCEGNICRSPIAEGVFRRNLGESHFVGSAGLSASFGQPPHPYSVEACTEIGIDISCHRSRPVDNDLLRGSDLVLVMESFHLSRLHDVFPWIHGRVWRLGSPMDLDFPDLLGESIEAFRRFTRTSLEMLDLWTPILRN